MDSDIHVHGSEDSDNAGEHQINFADDERGVYLAQNVREFAQCGGIMSMRKLNNLLKRLHPLAPNHLPLSYKTLLGTPVTVEVTEMAGDCQFWYKGISQCLKKLDLAEYLELNNRIEIDVNMDGLPLFKKSKKQFWPILGKLVGSDNQPFIIAIFFGKRTPTANELLREFADEVQLLQSHGYNYNGTNYPFKIRHFICDAPARAKPGGYCACEKCEVFGEWISNRTTYVDIDARLRTEESFRNQSQQRHHTGRSPLLDIEECQLVSQFRLDTLHLIYLGVWKRLLLAWISWNGPWKLPIKTKEEISLKFVALALSCPSDFNRPPRALSEIPFWAGTEFRRTLLYDGVVVFRDSLNPNVYSHFLLLHCALSILNSPIHYHNLNNLANELLRNFISHSVHIYGAKFVVYNVHNLCHLANECFLHGPSDSFSGFPFENKLGAIKKSLKSGYRPLQPAANRDLENEETVVKLSQQNGPVKVAKRHYVDGEIIDGDYFKYLSVNGVELKLNQRDSCVRATNGDVMKVSNIVMRRDEIFLFAVVKFIDEEDPEKAEYAVCLESWITTELDEKMRGKMKWPSSSRVDVASWVRKQKRAPDDWKCYDMVVKRFYGTYQQAVVGSKKIFEDTNYETENDEEVDQPRLKKKPAWLLESEEIFCIPVESQQPNRRRKTGKSKTGKLDIPPPPLIHFPNISSSTPKQQQSTKPHIIVLKNQTDSAPSCLGKKDSIQQPGNLLAQINKFKSGPQNRNKKLKQDVNVLSKEVNLREAHGFEDGGLSPPRTNKKIVKDTQSKTNISSETNSRDAVRLPCESAVKEIKILTPTSTTLLLKDNQAGGSQPLDFIGNELLTDGKCNCNLKQFCVIKEAMPIVSLFFSVAEDDDPPSLPSPPTLNKTYSPGNCNVLDGSINSLHQRKLGCSDEEKEESLDEENKGFSDEGTGGDNDSKKVSKSKSEELSPSLSDILVAVKKVNSKCDFLAINQAKFMRALMPGEKYIKRPEGMPDIPATNMKAFDEFNKFLKADDNLSAVSMHISRHIIKNDFAKSVRTLMGKVIQGTCVEKFTFLVEKTLFHFPKPKRGMQFLVYKFNEIRYIKNIGALLTHFSGEELSGASSVAGRWLSVTKYEGKQKGKAPKENQPQRKKKKTA
ncbi:hypothetical protein FOCC_FOCC015424 [Frankliniella occidentalis]|nr:hypothetical protein FOCC_FOCC015424 [Frankliniella occidentalis]